MFFADFHPHNSGIGGFGYVAQPGPRIMECMILAAAEMALADGRAQVVEYRGLLNFFKRTNLRVAYSRSTILERFSAEVSRIAARKIPPAGTRETEWQDIADRLRPLAGMQKARFIAGAAAYVAEADGVIHPREIELLRAVRDALEVGPAEDPDRPARGLSIAPIRPNG